jgi:asparagine synthase (glutamine-hydrolysing)
VRAISRHAAPQPTTDARIERLQQQVAQLKRAHETIRASVRDPYPLVRLPADVAAVLDRVRAARLSFLSADNLGMLAKLVTEIEQSGRAGAIVEAGTALGGSAIAMAAAKSASRPMYLYDVFATIPEPGERDGRDVHRRYSQIVSGAAKGLGGDTYYGYRSDLYAEVRASFERLGAPIEQHNVRLVKGLFEDTIELDEPVALAHLDGDWYESTMVCLERLAPLLVPGGRMVLDDYFTWSGCRRAVDDYFAGRSGYLIERRARLHVVRL